MKFDTYALKGRVIPAFLSIIIPIMIFNHFYVSEEFSKFVGEVFGAKLVSNLTISGICLFYLSEFGRLIGKNIFEKSYFKDERRMPTTNYLLFCDPAYSEQHKNRIRNKIKRDFDISLPTKEEEAIDQDGARTRIVEVMALIRKKLHGNKFLLQHNIEYGSMRNAIGGSVIGLILSLANILFFNFIIPGELAVTLSVITFFIYLLMIISSKYIIEFYGNNYAKILYREYLD